MWRFVKLSLLVPTVILIALFAVANRQAVRVSLDPLSREAPAYFFDAPLFAVVLAAVAVGVFLGGVGAWLAQGRHRKAERQLKREVTRLASETEALRAVAPQSALAQLPTLR
jgi:uncharacterized integral membrane protein